MTTEEWRNMPEDWRKGWHCCQSAKDIPEEKSEEWLEGYKYALTHPFGRVAVPM